MHIKYLIHFLNHKLSIFIIHSHFSTVNFIEQKVHQYLLIYFNNNEKKSEIFRDLFFHYTVPRIKKVILTNIYVNITYDFILL